MVSLGVIETIGLTAAIHAADAACKAAAVTLTGYRKVGSGLVSVYFEGEISAVKAAVDSGVEAIVEKTECCMSLVMARPDASVLLMLKHGESEVSSLTQSVVMEGEHSVKEEWDVEEAPVMPDMHVLSDMMPEATTTEQTVADMPTVMAEDDVTLVDVSVTPERKSSSARNKRGSKAKPQGSKQ